jgi:hypothetical protein
VSGEADEQDEMREHKQGKCDPQTKQQLMI